MIRAGIVAAVVTFTSLYAAPASVLAQTVPVPEERERLPEIEPAPETEADKSGDGTLDAAEDPAAKTGLSAEEARAAHLDQLFTRLADPEAEDWERVQAQIWQAWNFSGSDSMDLLAQRADKAIENKKLDTAMIHLNDLVRLAPDYAEGWNKRATLHFMKGDYGPSLDDIAETLKREPRHFGALSGLGIILDRIGDQEGALAAYRRAIEIHPNLPGAQDGVKKLEKEVEGRRL